MCRGLRPMSSRCELAGWDRGFTGTVRRGAGRDAGRVLDMLGTRADSTDRRNPQFTGETGRECITAARSDWPVNISTDPSLALGLWANNDYDECRAESSARDGVPKVHRGIDDRQSERLIAAAR
jgi:hypothetical protein